MLELNLPCSAGLLLPIGFFSLYNYLNRDATDDFTESSMESLSTGGIGEVGTIEGLTDEWQTIILKEKYSHPVIVAGLSGAFLDGTMSDDYAVARVRNIEYKQQDVSRKGWSFDIRLQEPV